MGAYGDISLVIYKQEVSGTIFKNEKSEMKYYTSATTNKESTMIHTILGAEFRAAGARVFFCGPLLVSLWLVACGIYLG